MLLYLLFFKIKKKVLLFFFYFVMMLFTQETLHKLNDCYQDGVVGFIKLLPLVLFINLNLEILVI